MRRQIAILWRALRPHQWLSNLVIFAPLIFSGELFNLALLFQVWVGFLLFCALSSVTFLVNDVIDQERDRRHPERRQRPVAAGELPPRQAIILAISLAVVALVEAFIWQPAFGLAAAGYLLLMVSYSLVLRRLPVVDVLVISIGLVLRAVAGALLIQVTISPWLYLSVGGLGLILALGRIQHEMRLAQANGTLEEGKYTAEAVARMNSVALACTLSVYCLYTFLATGVPADDRMMVTIPFVIFGIFRYRYLTQQQGDRSPERMMLADPPLLIAGALWALTAVIVLYWL
jgi:4-hydroxybenzoate polyprenyltransferase